MISLVKRFALAAVAPLLLTLGGCSEKEGSLFDVYDGEITINGITYPTSTFIGKSGGWDNANGYGNFSVTAVERSGGANNCWYYDFGFVSSTPPKEGDDLVKKELCFYCDDTFPSTVYKSVSGKVKVVDISKRDYTMVVDFQNLKMRSDEGDIYTFDGKVTVYFEEY